MSGARGEIPLSRPDVTEHEIAAVTAVLRTPHLSLGPRVAAFEECVAARVGARYAVAVSSGTAALHLCVRALGIGPGDEVITTPFSFVASANCVLFEGARPVFVDIDPVTLNLDAKRVAAAITPRTKALLPVHVFGLPAPMDALLELARTHGLAVIEDACEALGAYYCGRHVGTLGDCGTFGFYPNKQITTGEGGMIVTNREDIARLAYSLRNQGRDDGMGWLSHARLGYNYRLSDINCALGIAQMERLEEILSARAKVAAWYEELLATEAPTVVRPCAPPAGSTRSWFVYVVQLPPGYTAGERDALIKHLRAQGIGCNHYFPCIHLQPFYRAEFGYGPGDFPVAEEISARSVALPFYNRLQREEVATVARAVGAWLRGHRSGA
ncbi:MAG: DegT/DnrJ/EryC1/StrS family aminotransferase [bacterium]|nr:DegT/DnrJ/EryC1/StrS family aminotransferase [bacterium]